MRPRWLIAALLLSAAARAADDPASVTAEEVLARHAAAQGGLARLSALSTYHARGRMELTGFPISGTVESWFARPCNLRQSVDLGVYRVTLGCDDGVPWMADANGQITAKRDSATVASTLLSCLTQSFEYLRPGAAIVELCGAAPAPDPAEPPRICLRVREAAGGTVDLLLDPRTWLIAESRGQEQGHEVTSIFRDYRVVEGVPVAFVTEQRVPSVGQTMLLTLETVAFDEPLPDTLFALPRSGVRDFAFPPGASRVEAPLLYADNLLFLDVAVDGRAPEKFVIDSGAGTTVLDSAYAAALGVRGEATLPGLGGGGVRRARLASLPPLEVAGVRLEAQTGALLPLTDMIAAATDIRARGILGYDFLSRFVTRVDYAEGRIAFWDPDSFAREAPGRSAAAVDAPLAMNLFSLPATLDGCGARVLLDTGAAGSMLVRACAERCRLDDRPGVTARAVGIAGVAEGRAIRLDSLGVAGFAIRRPAVSLQAEAGGLPLGVYDGLLGNNVLERFVLTLDYRHQRVTLEPGPYFGRPRPADRSGLGLSRGSGGALRVEGVIPGSPAERAGLRPGDELIAIDGRPAAECGPLYRLRETFRRDAGTEVRLSVRREDEAREARITLEDYF